MRVRGGWKGQAALVLRALTGDLVSLWKLFWCWHKVLRKEGRWNKWHNILTTLWVWTVRRCGVMRIFTQILHTDPPCTLIYLESDNLNPNLAPSSELMVSPGRSGSGIIFLLRSAKEMRLLWGKEEGGVTLSTARLLTSAGAGGQMPPLLLPRWQSWSQHYLASLPRPSVHICRENICGAELRVLGAGWDHQEVMGSEARLSNCYETARLNIQLQSLLSNDPGGSNETTTAWL